MAPSKKLNRKNYNQSDLLQALAEIRGGLSYSKASVKYNIPKTTLADKLRGKYNPNKNRPGPLTALSPLQEKRLIAWIKNMCVIGYGRTKKQLANEVKSLLDQIEPIDEIQPRVQNLFKDNRPGRGWVTGFLRRYKNEISARTPQHLGHRRAEITEQDIRLWFEEFKNYLLEEYNIVAEELLSPENSERIFNMDESGFPLSGGNRRQKVLASKGVKNVATVCADTREQITVLACISAAGKFCTPYVIFPGERPNVNFSGINSDAFAVGRSPTGWMTTDCFFEYFANIFYEEIKDKVIFPIIVFFDGHSSHVNLPLSEFFKQKNIIAYCFPPHCSHIIQPLDVAVFGPLKKYYHDSLSDFMLENTNPLTKTNFLKVFSKVWEKSKEKELANNAFRKCGLLPFDPNVLDYQRLVTNKEVIKYDRKPHFHESLGLIRARNILENCLPGENVTLFRSLIKESKNLKENTLSLDLHHVWQTYKAITEAIESLDSANILMERFVEDQDSPENMHEVLESDNDVEDSPLINSLPEHIETAENDVTETRDEVLSEHSISGTPENVIQFECYSQSPFQNLLKIPQKFSTRKPSNRKNPIPFAVGGSKSIRYWQKKHAEKEEVEKKKALNKLKREKNMSDRQKKLSQLNVNKRNIEDSYVAEESDEEIIISGSFISEPLDYTKCRVCGNDDGNDEDWIGCSLCDKSWFHKVCLNVDFSGMTRRDIQTFDLQCDSCERLCVQSK